MCTIQFWAPFPKCYFSKFLDHELRDLESNFLDFLGKESKSLNFLDFVCVSVDLLSDLCMSFLFSIMWIIISVFKKKINWYYQFMNFPQLIFKTPKKAVTKFPITYTQRNNINTFDSKKLFHLSSIKVYA